MNTHTHSNSLTRSCRKILAQIEKARLSIFTQFRGLIADHDQALRLAINEAEALAWETPYPHLVFPDLAEEKARSVAAWSEHQREVRQQSLHITS